MDAALQRAQSLVGTSPGRPEDDFYPTPRPATEALLKVERFDPYIWEPACGDGAMSDVLWEHGYDVFSTDLHDHGYGIPEMDFLETEILSAPSIVTNPPFKIAASFMTHALYDLGCEKLALFCKLQFLEGQARSNLLDHSPLKNVWVFRKRIQLTRNGLPYKNGGMIAFAWYVWEKGYRDRPMVGWI